jgi:hypothetical protein
LRKRREGEHPAGEVKRVKSRPARELRFIVKNREAVLGASLRGQSRRQSLYRLGGCWGSYQGAIFYFFDVGGDPAICSVVAFHKQFLIVVG